MLIVEDQDYMRQMLREFLQGAFPGKNILEACDGHSALALCSERRPRVVLMDIGLTDVNGIDLTEKIKAMLPDTAVIIVSSHTGSAYTERARAAGAFAYVNKDAVHAELLPAINAALGRTPPGNNPRQIQ
ncbi:MAG: response regulator transcription factor [Burkholderiales bacterium]|nr:response regulator transcription factor [Burkholderiales bacterium]